VGETGVFDAQARLLETLLQFALEATDDLVTAAAQRELRLLVVVGVIRVLVGEMAQRRFAWTGT
jgi:hypothetical protein